MLIGNFMARIRKKAGEALSKCKTPRLSRPWMAAFLADAVSTADLPGAMSRAKVGFGDYVRGRLQDPAFDLACQEVDLILRHAYLIQCEAKAAAGDYRALKLLSGGLAEIRAGLVGQGVDVGASRRPKDRFPGRKHLSITHPNGPCLCCMSGLVVLIPWADGDDHEILVRHEATKFWGIPAPEGWEDAKVVYGVAPDPSNLALIPDDPEAEG